MTRASREQGSPEAGAAHPEEEAVDVRVPLPERLVLGEQLLDAHARRDLEARPIVRVTLDPMLSTLLEPPHLLRDARLHSASRVNPFNRILDPGSKTQSSVAPGSSLVEGLLPGLRRWAHPPGPPRSPAVSQPSSEATGGNG